MENVLRPNIFEYTNYRLFLSDLYDYLKVTTDYFSFRYFSKKAGFKSPNYLKLVIEGQRNISEESVEKFCKALKLSKNECDFFARLVGFTQASNNSERAEHALKILQSKIYQKLNPLTKDQLQYYSQWYQIGIRELALCKGMKKDPKWIAEQFRPQLTEKQALDAVESLIRLGMLIEEKDGTLIAAEQNVSTHSEVISSLVAVYHKEMMEKAKLSLDNASRDEREVSSICVPVSQDTFEKMKLRIQDFKKELMALASEDANPEQVYQLNLQLFPLTEKVEAS